jgi:hypothetical protein
MARQPEMFVWSLEPERARLLVWATRKTRVGAVAPGGDRAGDGWGRGTPRGAALRRPYPAGRAGLTGMGILSDQPA